MKIKPVAQKTQFFLFPLLPAFMALLVFDNGFYCPQGDFYIDPYRPVDRAILTHGHSDHARPGSKKYLAHSESLHILKARIGQETAIQTLPYGVPILINGVKVSLHPAGHIVGSAQVRVEYKGEVWVVSGDYKVEDDGISTPFEPVRCNHFVTESTFALPIYQWEPQPEIMAQIAAWVQRNRERDRVSVLVAYTLGKSQRIVSGLAPWGIPIFAHGATVNMHNAVAPFRPDLPDITKLTKETPREEVMTRCHSVSGLCFGYPLAAQVGTLRGRLLLGLDAGARRTTAPQCRCRLCTFRPCRLAWPVKCH